MINKYIDCVDNSINDHIKLVTTLKSQSKKLNEIASLIAVAIKHGASVYWYGNGGSAADAQHMAAELVSRFKLERRALRSQALTTDTSILTAIGNDYSFDDIFKRQVEAAVRKNDICIGLSTSGNSNNVYHAHVTAKKLGATTISLLGNDGGCIKEVSDYAIIVPSNDTPRIQEAHTLISHVLCDIVEQQIVSDSEAEEINKSKVVL